MTGLKPYELNAILNFVTLALNSFEELCLVIAVIRFVYSTPLITHVRECFKGDEASQ